MWKFGLKSKVSVDKGDSIKNSNITINSSDSHILHEIVRAVGRLEGEMKCMKSDLKYVRKHIEESDEELNKIKHSLVRSS